MARKEVTQYFDDMDGSPLASGEVRTVEFSWGGKSFVIDLSAENADGFDAVMRPYVEKAHHVARHSSAFKPKKAARSDLPLVRKWADENGYKVSDRGRIPQAVLDAYDAQ